MARKVKTAPNSKPSPNLGTSAHRPAPAKLDRPGQSFRHASKRAWAIVFVGGLCLAAGILSGRGMDERHLATFATFPWHVLQLWAVGVVLMLVGANSDASVYMGKGGRRKLVRDPLLGIGFLIVVSHVAALIGIFVGVPTGKLTYYALLVPMLIGAIGDFGRRRRGRS